MLRDGVISLQKQHQTDQGWAWMILLATFISNIITSGFTYANGIYFAAFDSYFHHGAAVILGAISINSSINKLIGPLVTILINKFGYRMTTIAGGIVTAIGFIASVFTKDMVHLYIFYGIFVGIGIGLSTIPSIAIVPEYFEKRRNFATAFSLTGMSIGIIIFPFLFHFMIEEYGWKNSMLLNSGIALNLCVCGALMREPSTHVKRKLIDISLWKNMKFNFMFVHYLLMHSIIIYFLIITKYVEDKGIDSEDSPLILSIFGFSNVFGRGIAVAMGLITINEYVYFAILVILTSLIVISVFVCITLRTFTEFSAVAVALGFFFGIKNNIMPCTSLFLFGQKKFIDVTGYILFGFGISTLITPPLAGWVADITGGMDSAMYLCGCLIAGSCCSGAIMVWVHWQDQRNEMKMAHLLPEEKLPTMRSLDESEIISVRS